MLLSLFAEQCPIQLVPNIRFLADRCALGLDLVVFRSQLPLALAAPGFDGGRISVTALRADDGTARGARAVARASNGRALSEANLML